MCFLNNHLQGYNFTSNDVLYSISNGMSGIIFSQRHLELSHSCNHQYVWIHKAIAMIEAIPFLGGIAALIERITFAVKEFFFQSSRASEAIPQDEDEAIQQNVNADNFSSLATTEEEKAPKKTKVFPWKPSLVECEIAFQKMWKNSKKAIEEHAKISNVFASVNEGLLPTHQMINKSLQVPLSLNHSSAAEQGPRSQMEDAHFYTENDHGAICGVFDGHGGSEVAEIASFAFEKSFFKTLQENKGNIHQTFEVMIDKIQEKLATEADLNDTGSTALVCYIDKSTHLIYTATLGDSEANIYRIIDGQMKSIPLSCVRNWKSQSDALRASHALNNPRIAEEWPKSANPKELRFYGINVSRAIGDLDIAGTSEKPGVIHKPKITINQVRPGDILVLACDGLKDFVPEEEITQILSSEGIEHPARRLVNYALGKAYDNISVIVINFARN